MEYMDNICDGGEPFSRYIYAESDNALSLNILCNIINMVQMNNSSVQTSMTTLILFDELNAVIFISHTHTHSHTPAPEYP